MSKPETVFNPKPLNPKNQYMFFGDSPGISRYDSPVYPIFQKLTEKQLGFFWRPEEFTVDKDSRDFKILSDTQKHIFTKNISFQILMDSVQARSPGLALLPHVSNSELESCIEAWQFFEMIHNQSYSYILRNIFSNPSEVFDNIIKDEEIIKRSNGLIRYYDDFINTSIALRCKEPTKTEMLSLKEKLLLCIASVNILEGLNFYVSFACSFAFAEQGLMEGNAKIITSIARDEALHLAITQNILKKWMNGEDDPDMVKLFTKNIGNIEAMFMEAIEMEKQWSKYLFKDGSMIGLSENILNQYVEFIAGKRMKNLGIKHDFIGKNPLPWTDKYLKSGDAQVAPQETEITSYVVGGVKNDVNDTSFGDISF
jgi:ribonucleotide reductase beta subunit family protein with ferritin-like domain